MTTATETIDRRLMTLRASARLALVGTGLGRVLLAVDLFAALTLAADYLFRLEWGVRLALLATGILLLLLAVWRWFLVRLAAVLVDDELALALERSHPFLRQALVSALQFSRRLAPGGSPQGESPALMARCLAGGEAAAAKISSARGLGWRRIRHQAALLAAALLLPVAAGLAMPATMAIWLDRQVLLRNTPWPQYTYLTVIGSEEGRIHAPRGEDFHLYIRAAGRIPTTGTIRWWIDGEGSDRGRLTRVGRDRLRFVFHALSRPLTFRVSAGDDETEPVELIPVDRPVVERLTLVVDEPDYTGRPERTVDLLAAEGSVGVLDRSRLTLQGETDKPLSGALLQVERRELPCRLDPEKPRAFRALLQPRTSLTLQVRPQDRHGLGPRPAPRVRIEVLPDRPPVVELKPVGVGAVVAPRVRIPLALRCSDDVALTAVALREGLLGENREKTPPLAKTEAAGLEEFTRGLPEFTAELLWTAKKFKLEPGRTLLLAASARDNFAPGEPHTSRTSPLRFKVVTEEDLLKELLRRQRELRAELESAKDSLQALREDLAARPEAEKRLPRALHGYVVQLSDAADGMAAILAEWENNRLPGTEKVLSLAFSVVDPLRNLAVPALSRARERASAWLMGRREAADEILPEIDKALATLRRVLATLSRLEDYQRVVEITRSLLRTQGEARKTLESRLQETLRDLFGGEEEK